MKIIRAKDYNDMSRKAANIISAQVIMKPDCVLGLATGSTPIGAYAELVSMYERGDLDFSQVTTINLDEYKGLTKENDQSYFYFMNEHLFSKVNVNKERTFLPDGTEPDSAKACGDYNQIIADVGGADLQLLGSDGIHNQGKPEVFCLHRGGAEAGVYHGCRDDHEGKKNPGCRKWSG